MSTKAAGGRYFRSLSRTIYTLSSGSICSLSWTLEADIKLTNKPSFISSRTKTQCIYFPHIYIYIQSFFPHCCSHYKTPWSGGDLLKWRSSIAPLVLSFPNKPHLATAACSSQITHNRRAIANICLPHTNRHSPICGSYQLTYSGRIHCSLLRFNFICPPSSISLTGLREHKQDLFDVVNRRLDVQSQESILETSESEWNTRHCDAGLLL